MKTAIFLLTKITGFVIVLALALAATFLLFCEPIEHTHFAAMLIGSKILAFALGYLAYLCYECWFNSKDLS